VIVTQGIHQKDKATENMRKQEITQTGAFSEFIYFLFFCDRQKFKEFYFLFLFFLFISLFVSNLTQLGDLILRVSSY
jgi:hypothetical protein